MIRWSIELIQFDIFLETMYDQTSSLGRLRQRIHLCAELEWARLDGSWWKLRVDKSSNENGIGVVWFSPATRMIKSIVPSTSPSIGQISPRYKYEVVQIPSRYKNNIMPQHTSNDKKRPRIGCAYYNPWELMAKFQETRKVIIFRRNPSYTP